MEKRKRCALDRGIDAVISERGRQGKQTRISPTPSRQIAGSQVIASISMYRKLINHSLGESSSVLLNESRSNVE